MKKYISKCLIVLSMMITFLFSGQFVMASEMLIFNNDHLRFGSGVEPSINNSGNLNQPFYYSQLYNNWRKLTYSSYPLDFEIREGGDGTNWWNTNGVSLYNPGLSGLTLDSTGFTPYENGTKGYGTIITNGTVNINGKNLQIKNTYVLSEGKSFIKVTTEFTNLSSISMNNLRYWVGTRDDYVGGSDGPTKEKGNLYDGVFANLTNQSEPARALRISTNEEGVLFYTDTDKANIIIGDRFGWNYVMERDPALSEITVAGDDCYAFYVRLNDLDPGETDTIVWYYAAGPINELDEIVSDVAKAAASVFNIGSETADFKSTSSASGTGYYVAVPADSTAPDSSQIQAGINYGDVVVSASGNGFINANEETIFNISGLHANTTYDLYFVVKDLENKYSSISKSRFTTLKYENSITFNQPEDKVYGDNPFSLNATADSGLLVSYTSSNPYVATVDLSGTVTIVGAGTTVITAAEAGNESYYPATEVERTLTVYKKDASVIPNALSKTYGDSNPELTGIMSGFINNDNVTATYSRIPGETVGTYTITVSALNPTEVLPNYNITFNSANFSIFERPITVESSADNKVYDGTVNSEMAPSIIGGTLAPGDSAVWSQKFDSKDVGTDKTISPSGYVMDSQNNDITYNYDITYYSVPGIITIADPIITLEDKTSSYTGSAIPIEPALVIGVPGEIPPGNVSYVYYTDRSCTTLTTPSNSGASANGQAPVYAGIYYVKATIEKTLNYSSQTTSAPGTLVITSTSGGGLSIGDNLTKTYGDDSFYLNATGGSGSGIVTFASSNPTVASVSSDGFVTINSAGSTNITATKASDGNYEAQYASITITVNKKPVTYTISNINKTYTGIAQFADVTPDVSNLVAGSDYTVTYYNISNGAIVSNPVENGQYRIVVTTVNTNYIGSAEEIFTIFNAGQIEFGIGGIPQTVEYGDIFTVYPNGNIGGVTTYEIVSGNATIDTSSGLVNITGIGDVVIKATNTADNFDVKTASATFKSYPKVITVTASAVNRIYEPGNRNVTVELVTGVDGLTAEYTSATMLTADAGVDKEVTVTGISLNSENYKPASTTIYTTVTIVTIPDNDYLEISGLPSSVTYGDDDFRLTATSVGTGEVVWSSSDISVAKINSSTGVVTIKGAGSAVITATKESDGNYEEISNSVIIQVGKKNVTYSIINNIKNYNGAAQYADITPNVSNLVVGSDYTVTYYNIIDDSIVSNPVEKGDYRIVVTTINSNYTGSTEGILIISNAGQIEFGIGGIPQTVEYGDIFTVYPNGNIGGVTTYEIVSGNATVDTSSGLVNITGIGDVVIKATNTADNFDVKTASATFIAYPKVITVTASAVDRLYDPGNRDVTVELVTGVDGLTAEYTSATMLTADAGVDKEVTVTGISLNNENYKPASTTVYTTVTIGTIQDQEILEISGLPSSITYGDDNFRLIATSRGTGDVIWSSSDISVAKANSSTGVVTIKGAGSAVITANKESDGNYESVSNSITIEVGKKDVTYSIINNTKRYTGTAQYAVVSPNIISLREDIDYKVIYSQDGNEVEEPVDAGVYDIYVETMNNNYNGYSEGATLTILEADQTTALDIGGLPNYIEYEDTFALYANGGNGEGDVIWTVASGSDYAEVTSRSGIVSVTGVGTVSITATKEGDGNYNDQVNNVTFTSNKKEISILISNTNKTYNGNEQNLTLSATPTNNYSFDDITDISYILQDNNEETAFRNVGTYNVIVRIDDNYSDRYVLEGNSFAVATIKKADITITAEDKTKFYGDANPTYTLSYDLLGTDEESLFNAPDITCSAQELSDTGYYDIVLSYDGDHGNSNYNVILVNGKLNIIPAPLTITADDKSIYYKKHAPAYTVSYSGFKGDDGISDLEGKLIFDCEYVRGSAEGEYDINISGLTSYNYDIEFISGKLTVMPAISSGSSGGSVITPKNTIDVKEVSSNLFENVDLIEVDADMENTFSQSVDVIITDEEEASDEIFRLVGDDSEAYPFDISLYEKGSNKKVQPNSGYKVKITLPLPKELLDVRNDVQVVYAEGGNLTTLNSEIIQKDGVWCIVFEAEHFSPYALVVDNEWKNPFDDVNEIDWFYDAVSYVNKAGLMSGTSNTTFEPYLETTRGMIVTILYRMEKQPEVTEQCSFSDVVNGSWYHDAIVWGSENGIVTGYDTETFGPEDDITREQMAAILYRYASYKEYELSKSADLSKYNDAGRISSWAVENIKWAVSEGLISGTTDTTLDPTGFATRAQVAAILMRFLENIAR